MTSRKTNRKRSFRGQRSHQNSKPNSKRITKSNRIDKSHLTLKPQHMRNMNTSNLLPTTHQNSSQKKLSMVPPLPLPKKIQIDVPNQFNLGQTQNQNKPPPIQIKNQSKKEQLLQQFLKSINVKNNDEQGNNHTAVFSLDHELINEI